MKRNEKILAGVLGVFVVGYFLRGPLIAVTTGPVAELQSEFDGRLEKSETLSAKKSSIARAAMRVNDARVRSLPADVAYAERLYPQWLEDFAQACGWESVQTELRRVQPRRGEQFRPIRVELRGRATLAEYDRFLTRFERTALMQRINSSKAFSETELNDVKLDVQVEVEAISLPTAADREEIFPLATLSADLGAGDTVAEVILPAGLTGEFPEEPGFLVRAGPEFLRVTAIAADGPDAADPADAPAVPDGADGETAKPTETAEQAVVWTVERGVEGSQPKATPAGSFLQLWPTDKPAEPLLAFSETGPFRKPREYQPSLRITGSTRLVRGDELSLTALASDFDTAGGPPSFGATDLPEGAEFNADEARVTWTPADDLPAGDYSFTLSAEVPNPATTLTETVTVTLVDRNTAPTVVSLEPATVSAGDVLVLEADATDAEDGDDVTFTLIDPPVGASIDPLFGLLRWEVPDYFQPGDVTLTLRAEDRGEPPMSGQATVRVTVREDLRPFVKFVGRTTRNGDAVATLFNQAENRITRLRVGDPFSLAGVTGEVLEIGRDTMAFSRNGRRLQLDLGRSLADAVDRGPLPMPERPTETPSPGGDGSTTLTAATDGGEPTGNESMGTEPSVAEMNDSPANRPETGAVAETSPPPTPTDAGNADPGEEKSLAEAESAQAGSEEGELAEASWPDDGLPEDEPVGPDEDETFVTPESD
ncbi:MAG: hypothetical protein AAF907_02925 [Planctomycetota bacterium]